MPVDQVAIRAPFLAFWVPKRAANGWGLRTTKSWRGAFWHAAREWRFASCNRRAKLQAYLLSKLHLRPGYTRKTTRAETREAAGHLLATATLRCCCFCCCCCSIPSRTSIRPERGVRRCRHLRHRLVSRSASYKLLIEPPSTRSWPISRASARIKGSGFEISYVCCCCCCWRRQRRRPC